MHWRSATLALLALTVGCASSSQQQSNEPQYNIVRPNESSPQTGEPDEPKSVSVKYRMRLLSAPVTRLFLKATRFGSPRGCWMMLTGI